MDTMVSLASGNAENSSGQLDMQLLLNRNRIETSDPPLYFLFTITKLKKSSKNWKFRVAPSKTPIRLGYKDIDTIIMKRLNLTKN